MLAFLMKFREQQQALFWLSVVRILVSLMALAFTTTIYARLIQQHSTLYSPKAHQEIYGL